MLYIFVCLVRINNKNATFRIWIKKKFSCSTNVSSNMQNQKTWGNHDLLAKCLLHICVHFCRLKFRKRNFFQIQERMQWNDNFSCALVNSLHQAKILNWFFWIYLFLAIIEKKWIHQKFAWCCIFGWTSKISFQQPWPRWDYFCILSMDIDKPTNKVLNVGKAYYHPNSLNFFQRNF